MFLTNFSSKKNGPESRPPLLRPHPAEVGVDKPFAVFGQVKEGGVRQGPRHYS